MNKGFRNVNQGGFGGIAPLYNFSASPLLGVAVRLGQVNASPDAPAPDR